MGGCHAIVTGCGRPIGIGARIARALAHAGCDVVITDIAANQASLREVCRQLKNEIENKQVFAVACDVTSLESCATAIADASKKFGGLDIVVNNAGVPQGADRADLTEVS